MVVQPTHHSYGFGMTPAQPDRRRSRSFDAFWKHRYGPAFRSIYVLFLAAFPTFVINVAVAVWIVFNPAPVDAAAAGTAATEPPTFAEGIPISINVVLGICLVVCLILAQRFMLHVLGRGASHVRSPCSYVPYPSRSLCCITRT